MSDVLYEVAGHVAIITLNRPQRRNALTLPMLDDLAEVVRGADADPEVRAIVLAGAGEGFCAGLDLVEAAAQGPEAIDALAVSYRPERIPVLAMHLADTPIVAAINGAAAGYGVGLALNADIRVMARSARFVPPTRRALVPESGDTYLLPRLAGWEVAARFYFLGAELSAEAALAAGVVSEVVDGADACRARAAELAGQIAALPPLAVQAAKRMMRAALTDSYPDHLPRVLLQLLPLFRSADFAEATAAFLQKRPAAFIGR
ncbi:MAG TPA: enoyl-CoA hydratase-related protein [Acidimicrobiia bacterium]|nr:enoyl-CoA hydratase-related protein [Acidimicrobiia bacterium]